MNTPNISSNPLVYTVVLNWNKLADIENCLNSLKILGYSNHKILVVDNGSTDGSLPILQNEYPEIYFLRNDVNLGFTGGNNIGIQYALKQNADYIWLLNNDCILESDILSKMIEEMEAEKSIGLLSPVINYRQKKKTLSQYGTRYYVDKNRKKIHHTKQEYETTLKNNPGQIILWGTALLIKRQLIEKIGLLNEKFFAYFEDTDYSIRSTEAGFANRVSTDSTLFHGPPGEAREKHSQVWYYYNTRNEFIFLRLHFKGVDYFKRWPLILARTLKRLGNSKRFGEKLLVDSAYQGILAGLLGHTGEKKKIPLLFLMIFMPLRVNPFLISRILELFDIKNE